MGTKRTAGVVFLAASFSVATCLDHEAHIEQRQYQQPETATYEYSYSTVAPPILIDYAGLWEFYRQQ
jgi:hypothetical protein